MNRHVRYADAQDNGYLRQQSGPRIHLLLPFRDMGLIDVRRFWVTTHVDGSGKLVVSDVGLAQEDEWEINRSSSGRGQRALRTCRAHADVPSYEKRAAFVDEFPLGQPWNSDFRAAPGVQGERGARQEVCIRVVRLGMFTAAVERHYRWKLRVDDLRNFDALPIKLKGEYPAAGVRPDALFDFTSQGEEKRLAGEARGQSERRPKTTNCDQQERLDQMVAWSCRNDFIP